MPNWKDLLEEIKTFPNPFDTVRRKYLKELHETTGRNIILYYSGWLQKEQLRLMPEKIVDFEINDDDINGFMTCIHQLDRTKGLDLVLHTPGGSIAATVALVDYLRSMFDVDIRAIVPQMAMSAGTMLACSCKEILMGKHSSLGPFDPHIRGVPAYGVLVEFERARKEIKESEANIPLWRYIIAQYHPTFIGECIKVIKWSTDIVTSWLKTGMFRGDPDGDNKAHKVISELGYPEPIEEQLQPEKQPHECHISLKRATDEIGLKVVPFDGVGNDDLQDAILSVHHASVLTFIQTPAYKIIENQNGVAFIKSVGIAPTR